MTQTRKRRGTHCHICGRKINTKTEVHSWALGDYYICSRMDCFKRWLAMEVKPE